MLRGDFHHHVNADPIDGRFVRHSAGELVDRAVAVGVNVLSITCHESVPYDEDIVRYGASRGVLVLRGMEATVDGQHVLLVNFPEFPAGRCSIADIRAAKTRESLVIAPHPFYPSGVAGADNLRQNSDLFDAVEFSGLYTPLTRFFNARASSYARRASLPVVGNSDTHFLWQMGSTYTEIDAVPEADAVLAAIRAGRVRLVTRPLTWRHVVRFIRDSNSGASLTRDSLQYLVDIVRRTRRGNTVTPLASPEAAPRVPSAE